jgi:hypothetical protein
MNDIAKQMKKIAGKRDKTDADLEELARLEWHGSLYLHDGRPCIPGEVLEAALITAAKKQKRGQQAQAGLLCPNNYLLEYNGPCDLDELWQDARFRLTVGARVQRNRIMRTRPRFSQWAADVEIHYDPQMLNEREVREMLERLGGQLGICDWRPRFGRFTVSVED